MSDAIVIGESWISEHYFTSATSAKSFQARVLARRKAWDEEEAAARERAAKAKEAGQEPGETAVTPRSRFLGARGELLDTLVGLAERLDTDADPGTIDAVDRAQTAATANALSDRLLAVLGITGGALTVRGEHPLRWVRTPGIEGPAPLAVVSGYPVATVEELIDRHARTLAVPVVLHEDGDEITSAARLVSTLFTGDEAPQLVLVLAGRWAMLAERERWAEGRYLAVDLQLVCERNVGTRGGEVDRALTCLSVESIAPDADGDLWWQQTLTESIEHTVGVSADLREGVRLSIEIIANDVVTRRREAGLEPLPQHDAQDLAKHALRFLYRILFLLYAEAKPELGVLPAGAPEYDAGYGLDRMRDLVQVELPSPQARSGTHLYESLATLFRLVDKGHPGGFDDATGSEELTFHPLRADLFRPEATAFIDEVGLGNLALQQVLGHLLLSKKQRGRDRGYISYAELGINQLGAVYEGLMSYTGFFADTDLYEVAKAGNADKGSWVVPVDRADGIGTNDFVRAEDPDTGEDKPVLHRRGSFVYRLAGRERQQSASYYTPEVLTRFTVGQALAELLPPKPGERSVHASRDDEGEEPEADDAAARPPMSARDILDLTICEPALGSGAFAIEAVRQLAAEYLERRQAELGTTIDPDEYQRELQKVKAYLALHNVHGVDLNSTAVELAEISLWLDTMVAGLDAPWFGLHLRRGNSLVGARRAVFDRKQVADKSWLTAIPRDVPPTDLVDRDPDEQTGAGIGDAVHHFLLPAPGWGAAADAKEAARLAPDAAKRLKDWRKAVRLKPTAKQVAALTDLAKRVESLWRLAHRRLQIAEAEVRRNIDVWGAPGLPSGGTVTREEIERKLADPNGAYRRLRRAMDAWCALWFWPLTEATTTVDDKAVDPPTLDQWIDALRRLLGRHDGKRRVAAGQSSLQTGSSWQDLNNQETTDLGMASVASIGPLLADHPWLVVCERVAAQQGFFHWNLDFATVFARGGFDLQLGNPPWVRPRSDVDALLAEGDPWWQLARRPAQEQITAKREETLALPGMTDLVLDGTTDIACLADYLGSSAQYPRLQGLQPDLYRCFMERMWQHASTSGVTGMIHLESHFTDERAGLLREELYLRLRRHWHFVNQLLLFEIQNHKHFGITIQGSKREAPNFIQASWLYHPETAIRSFEHDGSGEEPGLKDHEGRWDVRPHRARLTWVTDTTLTTWHTMLEDPDVPIRQTRMVYAVNRSVVSVLDKLSRAPRIGDLDLEFSRGWDESIDRKKGYFETEWGVPAFWDDVILQGPHLFVATPFYKTPNETMNSNKDWSATDFEALAADAVPATAYKPRGDRARYDAAYTTWPTPDGPRSARNYYRVAWRRMAANTGERTLIGAVVPPGSAHVHPVHTFAPSDRNLPSLLAACAYTSSIVLDFSVRCVPKSEILFGTIERMPANFDHPMLSSLVLRSARLNSITSAYTELWNACYSRDFMDDHWAGGFEHARRQPLCHIGPDWSPATPLRIAADRRQALVEIDALVALMLGLSAEELCTIYRTQFAVLYGYDHNVYHYDANGRLVPNSVLTVWRKKGDRLSVEEQTATNQAGNTYTYQLPFRTLDREKDMTEAYQEFERRLAARS
ncbi:restriction endonuclease subunit M [Actinocatenispora thailandica]|uniref:site-specific DNA-methyltransferase (adenine-specific) n=1 Tax=Actinocatenispora thailandica TaxID=227318 RepID=A0A7R7HYC1_9ACTN|nr:class I SAM-dependent DNA methyltransferase [Actinocatenispora thailandica]BCJ37162.1 restriction endonuclease subunit M [Actinocatenispora thailandica]